MQTWIHPPTGHWHQDSPLLMAQHLHQLSAWMHDTHRVLPGTGMFLVMAITECLCHHQWTFINSLCRVFHTAYLLSFTMHDLPRDSLWGCPFFTSDLIRCWSREMSTVDWMAWMEWLWKYQCEPYANRTQWSAWISASSASWTAVHSPSQWMARWIGLWGQSGSTWIECGHEKWMDFQQHPTPSNLTFQLYHWIVNMWTHYPHRWIINSGGMIPRWLLSYL